MDTVLVTGVAGFIGFHLAQELLRRQHTVVGIDNFNRFYDPALKRARIEQLREFERFAFRHLDLHDGESMARLLANHQVDLVLHMAAQPGVRYSQQDPQAFIDTNISGLVALLESCRRHPPAHFVFASSSAVYGLSRQLPYSVHHAADHPVSFYAATKKAGEMIVHSYSHLYGLPATGLRYFTVYGPWGRPDMAPMRFLKALYEEAPLDIYNEGRMRRDFTYIDDAVAATLQIGARPPAPDPDWNARIPDPASSSAPFRLYNIGRHQPVGLLDFVQALETATGLRAQLNRLPLQPGDVVDTEADVSDTVEATGLPLDTPLELGVERLVEWYRSYYQRSRNLGR